MELQYAYDNAIVAHTEEDLQITLNAFAWANKFLGLTLNIKKTPFSISLHLRTSANNNNCK